MLLIFQKRKLRHNHKCQLPSPSRSSVNTNWSLWSKQNSLGDCSLLFFSRVEQKLVPRVDLREWRRLGLPVQNLLTYIPRASSWATGLGGGVCSGHHVSTWQHLDLRHPPQSSGSNLGPGGSRKPNVDPGRPVGCHSVGSDLDLYLHTSPSSQHPPGF